MSQAGDVMIVVHDFAARSGDELNLRRGDRIELIERDDEFGDGWFLGKKIKTGETGLFPEVYTTAANKMVARTPIAALANAAAGYSPQNPESDLRNESPNDNRSQQSLDEESNAPLSSAMNPSKASQNAFARRNQVVNTRSLSLGSATHAGTNPVMNETLSVIEEHITDMHTPRQSFLGSGYNHNDDFVDESNPRLSYINGHETDEEDVAQFTEREVRDWNPSQAAEHLEQLGADRSHCEVFKEQEISGDVLLEMDKDTILLKEFELGTLGRRLALWKKIQNFQIDVKGSKQSNKATGRTASLTNRSSSGGPVLPKIPSLNEPTNYAGSRQRAQSASTHEIGTTDARHNHISRPSATSIHSVPHSRRHSSMDIGSVPGTPKKPPPRDSQTSPMHVKQASFDRTWTMGSQTTAVPDSHPSTASGVGASPSADSSFLAPQTPDYNTNPTSAVDLERGYFSSNENESRRFRNVLRKRDSGVHNRAPSDSHSALRLSGVFRHSRTGSTDSLHDTGRPSILASIKRLSGGKNASTTLVIEDPKDINAIANSPTTIDSPIDPSHSPISTTKPKSAKHRILGLRHISDAVTGNEKSVAKRKGEPFSPTSKEQLIISPSRTDSSNQSITSTGQRGSIEEKKIEPAKHVAFPTADKASKRKHKHETSAYLRGLEKKSPAEQIAGSDYSGWMKKKSRKLGKWHARLFVLRGCRLSYYYTEDDTEEKGLIDIAYHRVLPANKDLLTGFHATLTGAGSSPVSPSNATLQTAAQIDLDNIGKDENSNNESGIFIFKLVPPRPGLSKAVNFTEPKVHFFAVSSVQEGRKWMAALMKATIERDERKLMSSTYKEKTMSLGRAREMRVRPKEFQPMINEDGEIINSKTSEIEPLEEEDEAVKTNGKPDGATKGGAEFKDDKDDRSDGWSLVNGSVDDKATEAGLTGKSVLNIP